MKYENKVSDIFVMMLQGLMMVWLTIQLALDNEVGKYCYDNSDGRNETQCHR